MKFCSKSAITDTVVTGTFEDRFVFVFKLSKSIKES